MDSPTPIQGSPQTDLHSSTCEFKLSNVFFIWIWMSLFAINEKGDLNRHMIWQLPFLLKPDVDGLDFEVDL